MSCSCNNKEVDFCRKPKVSEWQLDMVRKMIKCLCKCGEGSPPKEEGGGSGCAPTIIRDVSSYPYDSHVITYRKNGGEIKTVDTFDFKSYEEDLAFNNELFGTTHNGIQLYTFYMSEDSEEEFYFGGGTADGLFLSPNSPNPIKMTEPYFYFGYIYEPPFITHPVETTIEIFRNTDVPEDEDMYFDFEGSETGEPIVFKSCSGFELVNGVLAPMPNQPGGTT